MLKLILKAILRAALTALAPFLFQIIAALEPPIPLTIAQFTELLLWIGAVAVGGWQNLGALEVKHATREIDYTTQFQRNTHTAAIVAATSLTFGSLFVLLHLAGFSTLPTEPLAGRF